MPSKTVEVKRWVLLPEDQLKQLQASATAASEEREEAPVNITEDTTEGQSCEGGDLQPIPQNISLCDEPTDEPDTEVVAEQEIVKDKDPVTIPPSTASKWKRWPGRKNPQLKKKNPVFKKGRFIKKKKQ